MSHNFAQHHHSYNRMLGLVFFCLLLSVAHCSQTVVDATIKCDVDGNIVINSPPGLDVIINGVRVNVLSETVGALNGSMTALSAKVAALTGTNVTIPSLPASASMPPTTNAATTATPITTATTTTTTATTTITTTTTSTVACPEYLDNTTTTASINIKSSSACVINFPYLRGATVQLVITSNANLETLCLPNTTTAGMLQIVSNPLLTTVELSNLGLVSSFRLSYSDSMANLSLPRLTDVGGDVTVLSNRILRTLDLPKILTVGGSLSITSNTALTSMNISSLFAIGGSFSITDSSFLTSLDAPNLVSVVQMLLIHGNNMLRSISLPNLSSVGGTNGGGGLTIDYNPRLTFISLPKLASVSGSVVITSNTVLTSIEFPNLTRVRYLDFLLDSNPHLTSVNLSSLHQVDRTFAVFGNPSLTSLDLPNFRKVVSTLEIYSNNNLETISMPNFTYANNIDISAHAKLSVMDMRKVTGTPALAVGDTCICTGNGCSACCPCV